MKAKNVFVFLIYFCSFLLSWVIKDLLSLFVKDDIVLFTTSLSVSLIVFCMVCWSADRIRKS